MLIEGNEAAAWVSGADPGKAGSCSIGGQGISAAVEKQVGTAGHAAVGVGAAEEGRLAA